MSIGTVALFVFGIAVLWIGSELIIRNIGPIAKFFGVRELVVTILGVSVFSSLPELSISALAAANGQADLSLGNVIGSNFVTLTFVTALCALIRPLSINTEIKERESSWMILSTAMILVLASDGVLSRLDGAVLVLLYAPYIVTVIRDARRNRERDAATEAPARVRVAIAVALEAAGIAGVIVGANLALQSGQSIGAALGIPPLVLGAILFAFGTSLPEMSIALSATFKKKAEISIGEIYASNIFTALAVLGICAIIAPMTITDKRLLSFDIPFLILAGVIVQIFVTTGSRFNRLEALAILVLYLVFVLQHVLPGGISLSF
ncbi:MAG TPA: sodium:calcium antiporter [Spirochaetota bacterium]|nr:sodium:calcium antiporter [Spirochaetota bacterium]